MGIHKDNSPTQTLASADLRELSAESHWIGANVTRGNPAVIETNQAPWGYSATLALAGLRQKHQANGNSLLWEVEVEVRTGDVGLSLINYDALIAERLLKAADGRKTIYLPAVAIEADLMVRNGPNDGKSQIAIYGVRLVQIAPVDPHEETISVCICTYRRPKVTDTVRSIFAQLGVVSNIEIVVCDDDKAGSARQWIMPLADHAPMSLKYVLCGSRNISTCRNTCLAESRGKWVAFIDDDEVADPNWLRELLSTQAQYKADVVKGYVRGVYPPGTPPWILEGDPFTRDPGPSGARPASLGTGNVMFRRNLVIDNDIWFNENLGRTGGEDSDFLRRLGDCGAHMVACQTAVVNEIVPPSRVQKNYLQRRYRRQGQVEAIYHGARCPRTRRLKLIVKYSADASKRALRPFVQTMSGKRSFEMFREFWYRFGMLEYTVGRQPFTID